MTLSPRNIAFIGLYISLCAASGFALSSVPNIEIITMFVFLGGILFGKKTGMLIGSTAIFIYSAFNPWGSGLAYPPLLVGQVFSYSVIGFAGGFFKLFLDSINNKYLKLTLLGLLGGGLTLFYSVTITFFTYQFAGFTIKMLAVSMLKGLSWVIWHIATNTIFFALLLPKTRYIAEKALNMYYFKDN